MAREYIARDPRTGKRIGVGKKGGRKTTGFAALSPDSGPWQRLEIPDILPLATGETDKVEMLTDGKRWRLGRIDAIKALSKVGEREVERAYETLVEALEDDFPDVRIAALKVLPSFALRRQGILLHCLSDRLIDEEDAVRWEAMNCLKKIAPLFPSGCEEMIRREMRDERKDHRDNAFETLKLTAREWPEVGCLHLDEIIREEDLDLRIRGSLILRTVASKGGAEAWDLITWSLQDEEVRVRRNAAKTLTILADVEPRVAVILVESSLGENDKTIRNSVIKALKKLDIQSPRVVQMILKGASDNDLEMRKACVSQISIILSGQELREAAGELLKNEKDPGLKKRLQSLALDPDFEGSEEEKNRKLAPAEYVPKDDEDMALPDLPPLGENDKRQSGRPASEEGR
ncbi:MAG: HEAT repeat domain-containing protein [Candidatus Thalassarchaeaceae archaeon]|nr:HEAT repeat domain-containing protein [Candidatus Thalassarchaeaceae archaeon]